MFFFVLSGYLMTKAIVPALKSGRFEFCSFYHARAKRIIPALLVLCVVVTLFGYFCLPVDEFRTLGREVKSSLLFYSNFALAASSGYFESPKAEHWLLHTWSLSVEWQFYIVYPVLLLGLYRFLGIRWLFAGVLIAGVLSYIFSVYLTSSFPNHAFYMLPARAFELLAGAAVYLCPVVLRSSLRPVTLLVGAILIIACALLVTESLAWPGYLAGIPVLGTALVIMAACDAKVFQLAPVQYLGNISYSAYLWHWPVVVLLYFCGLLSSLTWTVLGIAFSLMVASLSYRYVECRFRTKSERPGWSLGYYFSITILAVSVSAGVSSVVKRYPNLRSADLEQGQPKYASSLYEQHCTPNSYGAADCILGEGDVKVILFGDSHAQSHAAAVQIHNRGAAVGWALGGCPMLVDFSMRDKERERKCQRFNREKLEILSSNYIGVPVVLFNYYQLYMEHNSGSFVYEVDGRGGSHLRASYEAQFESVVCGIAKTHPVYLVKQTPRMPFSVYKGAALQERLFNTKVDFSIPFSEHLRRTVEANRLIDSVAKNCNVKMIDPAPLLCPNGRCLGTLNHEPLYFDDNHLVDAGNKLIQGVFLQVFD